MCSVKLLAFCLALIFTSALLTPPVSWSQECTSWFYNSQEFKPLGTGFEFRDAIITSDAHYPLGKIVFHLEIGAQKKAPQKKEPSRGAVTLAGSSKAQDSKEVELVKYGIEWNLPPSSRVLSVGEGMSQLTYQLRADGYYAVGADQWYGQAEVQNYPKVKNYLHQNKESLVGANAQLLPFKDNSFNVTLSHMLFPYLSPTEQVSSLEEMIRVTQNSGIIKIVSFSNTISKDVLEALQNTAGHQISERVVYIGNRRSRITLIEINL